MRISDWSSDVCSSDLAFNTSLVGPGGAAPADPEKNTNFEIGMKAETADHKLQGSIVAFYTDYRNNQTLTIPPGALTTVIYNLPKATIQGIEAEFLARPFGGLSINGHVGLLWTQLDAQGVLVAGLPVDKIGRESCRERVCQSV